MLVRLSSHPRTYFDRGAFDLDIRKIMAENHSNFTRDWINQHVQSDPFYNGSIEVRVGKLIERLKNASKEAEIPQDDPELAPDLASRSHPGRDLRELRSVCRLRSF